MLRVSKEREDVVDAQRSRRTAQTRVEELCAKVRDESVVEGKKAVGGQSALCIAARTRPFPPEGGKQRVLPVEQVTGLELLPKLSARRRRTSSQRIVVDDELPKAFDIEGGLRCVEQHREIGEERRARRKTRKIGRCRIESWHLAS